MFFFFFNITETQEPPDCHSGGIPRPPGYSHQETEVGSGSGEDPPTQPAKCGQASMCTLSKRLDLRAGSEEALRGGVFTTPWGLATPGLPYSTLSAWAHQWSPPPTRMEGSLEPMTAEITKEDSPSKDLQVKGYRVLPNLKKWGQGKKRNKTGQRQRH